MTTQTPRDQLNAIVKEVAARDRPAAVKILGTFGVLTTPQLKPEDIPAAHAAFVAALKKFDGSTP